MAAKLLRSLTDDNPDLQKQIGCMTGIFQLFDRQHTLTTRRITGHSPRRGVPSGCSQFHGGTLESESNISYSRSGAVDKHSSKHMLEKQRLSTESSRASFSSSSRSSSFSSLDYNKNTQPEPSSSDQIIFPETNSGESGMSQTTSPQICRQTVDLREVVKDSMYREAHGLPVKSTFKDDTVDSLFKHRDSPRPLQFSRSNEGSYGLGLKGKQDLPVDLKESLRVLSKFQETPWYPSEPRELSRSASYQSKDGSFFSIAKEAPRFSYDGRDMRYASFESRDASKSSLKFKELPRLSLDSRENSMRSFKSDSQSLLNPLQRDSGSSNHNTSSQQQTSGSQVRPPSVVAKLMGLETLPSSVVSSSESIMNSERTYSIEDSGRSSKSPNTTNSCRPFQISSSSRNLWKEPKSPRWKNSDSTLKPASRFPIEPAPWKQLDGNRTSQKPVSKNVKSHSKAPNSFPSVYSEIEKRLKDLEFSQSGKDLRALKQILEAMQAKGLLESQKGEDRTFASQEDIERKYTNSMSGATLVNQQKLQHDFFSPSAKRGTNFSRNFESPIVIMKPAKLVEKSGIPASSVISLDDLSSLPRVEDGASVDGRKSSINGRAPRDQIPKSTTRDKVPTNMRTNTKVLRSTQMSTRTSQSSKENNTGSLKSSGSISPRMQQKKQELERRSRPPIPPPDSSRPRRNSSKQGTESSSPGGRRRLKSTNLQHIDDQLCEIRNELRSLSCHENEISAQSDGSFLSESRIDFEVTSSERSPEMSSCPSPSTKPAHHLVPGFMGKKSSRGSPGEEELLMDHPVDAPEYPSPVSVLDVVADMDDSPSPVKHTKKALRDDESRKCDTVSSSEQCKQEESLTMEAVGSGPTSEINRKKLQNIENLVQKLRRLNSSHDEARTDYIASLCENSNPDHRYISEILLASGLLLRDLGSSLTNFQFHPSGHPINPELFLVLEQTKASSFSKEECSATEKPVQLWSKEKIQRKLIFDTINEILAKRLSFLGPSSAEPWLRFNKLARKTLNAQKLLRELCLETEDLQAKKSKCSSEEEDDGLKNILWEDVMHRSESWTDFNGELSSIVLDVERLIFKDLVGEIVMGEAPGLKNKQIRRRQLFAK